MVHLTLRRISTTYTRVKVRQIQAKTTKTQVTIINATNISNRQKLFFAQ